MGLFNFLFRRMCYAMFDKVDRDKSGYIEAIEVEVAIYRLYNIINKRLPGWQDPPTRQQIMESLKTHDKDMDARLNKDEFVEFARGLVRNGPDMFFMRVGRDAAVKTAVLPASTRALQELCSRGGFKAVADVPLHIAAPTLGCVVRAVSALIPVRSRY